MECACVIAVPDEVKCAKTALEEESPKERHVACRKDVYVGGDMLRAMQLLVRLR